MTGFTIFIPVYNEAELLEKNLGRLFAYLQGLGRPFEVIVGSNGSTDQTVAIGRRLSGQMEGLTFFHLEHKGPGLAFREGVRRARYDWIISQDMDLSVDLDFIRLALELMDDYDMVIGSKMMGTQQRSWTRIVGSGSFILAARFLLGLKYRDYSLAAKAYKKELVERFADWIDSGTSYVLNLAYWAHQEDRPIKEVPVFCRDERESRFNLTREGLYRFSHLFQLWLHSRCRRP